MQASQTQIDAFHSLSTDDVSASKRKILDLFKADRRILLTRDEIAARTNMQVSTVCGRVNELVKAEALAVRDSARRPGRRCRQQLIGLPLEVAA
ncbi:winged helix-turn-helix domain-containing protein [Caballeronia sp. LZ043]|uniref:winged helix-turn-helix domain-containing protein n=1 Tax=Caballeronia sp. LZ043 TaxID=3038569 RepID=UPI002864AD63|nr:winged helix-turn-helix domain-containing protein [Caballeronia sp. LZ043]MDR5825818.1 winged helix-turn-helix domain-containing protein [Caballeronia sp. LZ043]